MSQALALQAPLFDGHPVRVADRDGRPWFVARDLAEPLDIGRDVLVKRVAELDDEDKGVHSMHTPGGTQSLTVVSESGAIQLVCQSRKPAARRLRKFVADLAVAWNRGELVPTVHPDIQAQLSGQTAALTALNGEVNRLRQRLDALEATPRMLPSRFHFGGIPQHEVDAFDAAWRETQPGWDGVAPLVALCLERNLLSSLLDPTMDVRGHGMRLGRWLAARADVDKRRTTNGRRIVQLSSVVELATRRSS